MAHTTSKINNRALTKSRTQNRLLKRSNPSSLRVFSCLSYAVFGALFLYLLLSSALYTNYISSEVVTAVTSTDHRNRISLNNFIKQSSQVGDKRNRTLGYQEKSTTAADEERETIISNPKLDYGNNSSDRDEKHRAENEELSVKNPPTGDEQFSVPERGEEYVKKAAIKLILRAYIETTDQSEWEIQPLPTRTTKSTDLKVKEFPEVSSCTRLTEQWPIDEEVAPTNLDPFLPWIHDVFPTADGKFIQFVAQNKRRCQTGKQQQSIKDFMQPNVALFQHVPVKRIGRIDNNTGDDGQHRYRISTHEEADEDGIETRFICRFKPSMEDTLSVFNFNYDYNAFRKGYLSTFTKEGFDVHMIFNSQLLFRCPVPESLQDTIRSGSSIFNDYATQFVDLIPIRTPPRYIYPNHFLPPRFGLKYQWNVTAQYGSNHILPKIEDSGRWENIPICKPSLMTYPDDALDRNALLEEENDRKMEDMALTKEKKHKLIMCTWTSAGFHTRGERTFVTDGPRRLLEWLHFVRLVGVDHVYIYDNSGALSESESLKPVTDLFPGFATRINWPCKVCNNRSGDYDNKGERSSQYAAESSCRLRFGAHSDWLGAFDTDEYPVPVGSYDNLITLLDDADREDTRVLSFASQRSKPRLRYLNSSHIPGICPDCLDPTPPNNTTFLETYNCNYERPPRKVLKPAEKQIYRTDYVLLHFVHYSAITTISAMTAAESNNANFTKYKYRRVYRDAHTRFVDETIEATMLHAKSVVAKETSGWSRTLQRKYSPSLIGIEYPPDGKASVDVRGASYAANCFPIELVDNYWTPRLKASMQVNNS